MASLQQTTLPFALTSSTSPKAATATTTSPQILLVLAGVLGTGKSTLANAMADQLTVRFCILVPGVLVAY